MVGGLVSSMASRRAANPGATVVLVASSAGVSRSASRRYSLSAEPAIFRPLLFTQVHDVWAQLSARGGMLRMLKDHLASWRHSAHTATLACGSKVIDGRIDDTTPG